MIGRPSPASSSATSTVPAELSALVNAVLRPPESALAMGHSSQGPGALAAKQTTRRPPETLPAGGKFCTTNFGSHSWAVS